MEDLEANAIEDIPESFHLNCLDVLVGTLRLQSYPGGYRYGQ
jgi:hypothetical protein